MANFIFYRYYNICRDKGISKLHHPIQYRTNFTSVLSLFHRKEKKEKAENYDDPLNYWWVKAATYSNEVGTTIREMAPKLGQALWIPSIMYLGADIYDKYKNDKNHYDPSGKRGLERVIYQGVAGFLLPSGAIYLGQKLTSPVIKLFNRKLSINAQETTLEYLRNSVNQCIGGIYDDKQKFKNFLLNSLENKIAACRNEKKTDNYYRRIIKLCNGSYALAREDKEKILEFADKNLDRMFEIQQALKKGVKPKGISSSCYKKYLKEAPVLEKIYGKDNANDALGFALKNFETRRLFKYKVLKTIGGLISLALFAKPIDYFVSDILMPKIVDPGLRRFNDAILDRSALKSQIKNTAPAPTQAKPQVTDNGSGTNLKPSSSSLKKLPSQPQEQKPLPLSEQPQKEQRPALQKKEAPLPSQENQPYLKKEKQ